MMQNDECVMYKINKVKYTCFIWILLNTQTTIKISQWHVSEVTMYFANCKYHEVLQTNNQQCLSILYKKKHSMHKSADKVDWNAQKIEESIGYC